MTASVHETGDVKGSPIESGGFVDVETKDGVVRIQIGQAQQRNWSRVALGHDEMGHAYFIKQFIDRSSRVDARHMESEAASAASAQDLYPEVEVLQPVGSSQEACLLMYPFRRFRPLEKLLGAHTRAALFPAAERWVNAVLNPAIKIEADQAQTLIPAFKGLDFSNVGLSDTGALILFDLGPQVFWTRPRIAARLIVTTAYANWKRNPMKLLKGPPREVIALVGQAMRAELDTAEISSELARERMDRLATLNWGSWRRRIGVNAGGRLVGRYYANLAAALCLRESRSSESHFDSP